MLKSFIIIVLYVTGCLCKAIPDEVPVPNNPEGQTDLSDEEANIASKSDSTQELSKEAGTENKESISNSESPEESADSKSANSENTELKDIQVRSTEDGQAANSENNEEAVVKTNPEAAMTLTSENSDISTGTDSKGDEVTRTSRNSEDNASAEVKSASVETETGEHAAHIQIKEQTKQAPDEENLPSHHGTSEENSKTASGEKESTVASNGELKSSDEKMPVRAASPEENKQSYSDADRDDTKSAEVDEDVVGFVRPGAGALVDPSVNRRMLNHNPSHQDDEVDRHSSEAASGRMAPQEETPSSGHQVPSHYLGGSRSDQSQYPYSPIEGSTVSPVIAIPSSKESNSDPVLSPGASLSKLLPRISSRNGYPDISFQNPIEKNRNEPSRPRPPPPPTHPNEPLQPVPPHPPQRPNDERLAFRQLPPPPPPQTAGPYKPQPQQPPQQPFRQIHPSQQLELVPSFKPDCIGCNNPPIQNWQPQQTFQNLLPPWSLPTRNAIPMTTMRSFNPLHNNSPIPNMLSIFRQAVPEGLPQISDVFSGNWNTAFQASPFTVSSSVRSLASGFSSF